MTTPVSLPSSVPFPVTITFINCRNGEDIKKHQLLLKFKYWDYQEDPSSKEATPQKIRVERIGTLESPIEGKIVNINTAVNKEIAHSGHELFQIEEPCSHTVQYGGLCALCGKAVEDEKDYTGFSYEDRATIEMSHDNTGLRISLEEAQEIEKTATERLSEARKLILVVDLDQTVIHATVDPTVGEWQQDPLNPNYPFVSDVKSFFLEEEPPIPPGWTGPKPSATKCWYYVKLRPGLETFLKQVSKLYELHIYTMATRNYALAISKIIDPNGEYFGDRILSRDESGLITHKNLKRLFPVDQSMVAIIDDRGDVWQWEANLVKVVPYDFFVGIGDINLSFLPKKNGQLLGPTKKRKVIARLEALVEEETEESKLKQEEIKKDLSGGEGLIDSHNIDSPSSSRSPSPIPGGDSVPSSPVDRIILLGGGENNQDLLAEQSNLRSILVEQQQHDRPLAKLQLDLDKATNSDHNHNHGQNQNHDQNNQNHNDGSGDNDSSGTHGSDNDAHMESEKEEEDHLLYDDDRELIYLESALEKFHKEYYRLFSLYQKDRSLDRPDLTHIIPNLKEKCLKGIVVLFSGILPLGLNVDDADIVIWCRQFGIEVVSEVYPNVTHVVCRDPNTSHLKAGLTLKARVAKKTLPNVKVVSPDWLFACLSQWKEVPADEYEIDVSDKDWYVSEKDVLKYRTVLDAQMQRSAKVNHTYQERQGSLGSIEDYDLNEASDEVDDFLAGISDDDSDDGGDGVLNPQFNENGDADDDEDEDDLKGPKANGHSFVKSLYTKRNAEALNLEDESEEEPSSKKTKMETHSDVKDIDELEQELLDELDHLSD